MSPDREDSFVVEGKLALPYQYFAGRTGSRFLIALRDEKKIMGLRCEKCDRTFIPPRSTCERCLSDISENWVELKDTGTVTGFTVVRYAEPHQPAEPPYILALIKLDGADTPIPHIIEGIRISEVKAGLRVKAAFAKRSMCTIMDIDHFRADEPKKEQVGEG
jgi:uncharacterized OB-fold protein